MNTRLRSLTACLLVITTSAFSQSDVGRPVTVGRGDLRVTVGCEGSYSLPSDDAVLLAEENRGLDRLIFDMSAEMIKLSTTDSARQWAREEQRLWYIASRGQCRKEARARPKAQRAAGDQGCRTWAGRCRLMLLLERYDELIR
ncbi:MAG: hypothetical protein JNM62_13805 [Flavobacteriales bacterium]|nr:hypothetical protein [Flavobacteriales bacterium]